MHKKVLPICLLCVAFWAGCSKQKAPEPEAQSAAPEVKIDLATAGSISGEVTFAGVVPKLQPIDMTQDPACRGQNAAETVMSHDGRLANVFVYVKDGLPAGRFPVPAQEVPIKQHGCRYEPHVVGVMAGQTVKILNSDDTTHNIHPMPEHNKEWNQSQSPGAEPIVKKFTAPELMVPVKCNAHPWMKMYVNVAAHPFFAVTAADGRFNLAGLPPGTYTVAAVHEKLGEQTARITVGPKQSATADFTFSGAGNTASSAR